MLPKGWKQLLDFIEDRVSWWGRLPNQDPEETGAAPSPQSSGPGGFLSPLSSLDDSCDRQYRCPPNLYLMYLEHACYYALCTEDAQLVIAAF